jgi:hypothetical protein
MYALEPVSNYGHRTGTLAKPLGHYVYFMPSRKQLGRKLSGPVFQTTAARVELF